MSNENHMTQAPVRRLVGCRPPTKTEQRILDYVAQGRVWSPDIVKRALGLRQFWPMWTSLIRFKLIIRRDGYWTTADQAPNSVLNSGYPDEQGKDRG